MSDTSQPPVPALDLNALLDELAFIAQRARELPNGGSTTVWRRSDSYEGFGRFEPLRPSR